MRGRRCLTQPKTKGPDAACNSDEAPKVILSTEEDSKNEAPHQGIQSWDEVDDLATELGWMSLWRDVLQWKFNSPHRHFEPAHLEAELNSFRQILEFDRRILAWHRSNATSRRLDTIPGIGPALATALVASVADPKAFRSGRNFSAWIGLVPKQHSSGGKHKLGSISKQGDRYLRSLFTAGALAVIRYAKIHGTKHRPWLTALLARRPTKVAAIALANKIARMAWAMMAKGESTRRACGVNEIAPVIRRDVEGWEGEQHVMQSRSIRRSGQPTCASASSNAGF